MQTERSLDAGNHATCVNGIFFAVTGETGIYNIIMSPVSSVSAFTYKDCNMTSSDCRFTGSGTFAVFTSRSPEKSGINEDSAAVIRLDDETSVLMVADGVGGLPSGGQASSLVIDLLLDAARSALSDHSDLRDVILSAIEEANQRIINYANGSATTLAVVELHGNAIRTYHVGDSMIMVVGQRGKLKMETISHSPVGYAVGAGMLSAEEAIVHDDLHIVSNVVGSQEMHISMGIPYRLAGRDTLLIATDGLFDNIPRDEIIDMIRAGPLQKCADRLAAYARKRMEAGIAPFKPDDLTFILYRPSIPAAKK